LKLTFQQVVIHPDRTPNKRVTPFLLCWCKLPRADFRMCDAQRFGCNFLHRSPKLLILDALESRLNGALEYPIFLFCRSLKMCLILMKTAVLLSGFWRCWWFRFQLLSRTQGSDSLFLQNNYKAQSTPEVTVRNTHPMPTNHDIPMIFTCGIVNLAKILMGVRECKCVWKWKDGIKTKQCLCQILSSMLKKWMSNFSLAIKIYYPWSKHHAYPKINNSSWCKISRAHCKVYKQSNAIW
jgi:hypothetical protein